MASVVDIANLALSHIGDRATLASIDPPEGSAQADHCARFWPIARDEALASFDWGFASRSARPARLADNAHDDPEWEYSFQQPADFLVAREMIVDGLNAVALLPGSPHFSAGTTSTGNPVLLANQPDLMLRYTRRVNDPSRYSPKFVTALSYLLASYLAGPVIKGRAGAQTASVMRQAWDRLASEAKAVDANQSFSSTDFKPAGLRARGYGAGSVIVERGPYRHELPFWARG